VAPAPPSPNLPAPSAPPLLPSSAERLKTAITEGPSGTINYNNVTFRWASTLSSVDPSTLAYSTFLKGYDQDYTPFVPDTARSFTNLPDKSYVFYVKAQDRSGNVEDPPASQAFIIANSPPGVIAPAPQQGPTGDLLLIGASVSRIAVGTDGKTVYALDAVASKLYKSDSAGMLWSDISARVTGGLPWTDLAIAPDDPGFVAVVTDSGREVYISTDGGNSFNDSGLPAVIGAQAVTCITISPGYGKREIAVGTYTGAAGGRVLIDVLSAFSGGWFDASTGKPGWPADVFAISYSPSFGGDSTLLAVASSVAHTYLYAGLRDLGAMTITWNTFTGYPVEVGVPGVGTPGTPVSANISLPSDYNSGNPYNRRVFVSWNKSHPGRDVYHISDYQVYRMSVPAAVASIAFYGSTASGKMLAGAASCISGGGCFLIQTYFTANPTSSYPTWQPSAKPATGASNAQVAWSADGTIGYVGTSGSGRAFSHSRDNGYTWNQ